MLPRPVSRPFGNLTGQDNYATSPATTVVQIKLPSSMYDGRPYKSLPSDLLYVRSSTGVLVQDVVKALANTLANHARRVRRHPTTGVWMGSGWTPKDNLGPAAWAASGTDVVLLQMAKPGFAWVPRHPRTTRSVLVFFF